jgi:hypothetical protein
VKTRLATYLDRKKLSHRKFAQLAGIPKLHPMITLWARGISTPGLDSAFAIERATEGAIPASYWLTIRPTGRGRRAA